MYCHSLSIQEEFGGDFPGGLVDKNPPTRARDTGLIPIQEDLTLPQGS